MEERLSDTPSIKMTEGEYDGAFISDERKGLKIDFEDDLSFDDLAFESEKDPFEILKAFTPSLSLNNDTSSGSSDYSDLRSPVPRNTSRFDTQENLHRVRKA